MVRLSLIKLRAFDFRVRSRICPDSSHLLAHRLSPPPRYYGSRAREHTAVAVTGGGALSSIDGSGLRTRVYPLTVQLTLESSQESGSRPRAVCIGSQLTRRTTRAFCTARLLPVQVPKSI